MAKGFVYRGKNRTAEDVTKKASEGSRDYDSIFKPGIPTFKPKEGENVVRILPSTWEEPDWDFTIYRHYSIGPDNASYLCLEQMKGEACPVCETRQETADEDEKDALRVSKGAICWVIDRDDEKAGPQIWPLPFTKVRNEIYARSLDRKTREAILIDDPEEGYDITFFRKGTGERTQYTGVEVARDASPISESEKTQQRWLDYISEHPLPECLNYYSYEHIKKALYGKATKKQDDDEDEAPVRRSRLAKEDDDEEDEQPKRSSHRSRLEEEDEEDEKPVRRSRRSVDDEEEDEEAVRPVRRSRGASAESDDDVPFDKKDGKNARRRAVLDEEEGDEDEQPKRSSRGSKSDDADEETEEEDSPSSSARRQLNKLRPAGKRGR